MVKSTYEFITAIILLCLQYKVNHGMMYDMKIEINRLEFDANQDICIAGGIEAVISLFQDHKCFYCLTPFVTGMNHPKSISWDHFLPKSKGYTFSGNLILACRTCNTRKRSDLPSANQIRRFVKLYDDAGLNCMIKILEDDGVSGRVRIIHQNEPASETDED